MPCTSPDLSASQPPSEPHAAPLTRSTQTHRFLNSYSLTFSALSSTSSAFGPRIVTWHAIFSFLRIEKLLTV